MTTIAYRDGIMASDSGSWNGDACHGWAEKMAKGPDRSLHGCSGGAAECEAYLQWVRDGMKGESPKPRDTSEGGENLSSFIVMIADGSGLITILTAQGPEKYRAPYFAIGAGAPVAFGAMFAGADASTAIEAAMAHGSGAFGDVQSIDVSGVRR